MEIDRLRTPLAKLTLVSLLLLVLIWFVCPQVLFLRKFLFQNTLSQTVPTLIIIMSWCAFCLCFLMNHFLKTSSNTHKLFPPYTLRHRVWPALQVASILLIVVAILLLPVPWLSKKSPMVSEKINPSHSSWAPISYDFKSTIHHKIWRYLNAVLTQTIRDNLNGSQLTLYKTLEIYLLLTEKNNPQQGDQIKQWFFDYWQQQFPQNPPLVDNLMRYLNQVLQPHTHGPINGTIVQQARAQLNQLPLADMAFLILRAHYHGNIQLFAHNQMTQGLTSSALIIPEFYSAENFKRIYDLEIPQLNKVFAKGDWVLGKQSIRMLNPYQRQALTHQVRLLYTDLFRKHWRALLKQIQLTKPQNHKALLNSLNLLLNKQSTLHQWLSIILANATLNLKPDHVDPQIKALSDFLNQQGSALPYLRILKKLDNPLQTNPSVNSPSLIKELSAISSTTPPPIQQWLMTIVHFPNKFFMQ